MESRPTELNETVGRKLIRPLTDFLHTEAGAGILLVFAAAIALVWANSPWSGSYTDFWGAEAFVGIDGFLTIDLTIQEWINDAAMVIFFFVAGLEIKREITQGELRDPRHAALPIIGAFGGMIVPAVIFTILNAGTDGADGWGIPMATDIAIVMGVVALLGSRIPSWLKLFLLALAIVDDIGAIVVIALFYSSGVSFAWLSVSLGAIAIAAVIRQNVNWIGIYIALGVICWVGLHEAHIHPTLAGVAFGMLAPVAPRGKGHLIDADELAAHPNAHNAYVVAAQAKQTVSIVEWLEHKLHPYSAFIIVPVFALANAGVHIPADQLGEAMSNRVTWGVILGLVVGKMIGVTAATLGAVALGIGKLPAGVTRRYVIGAAALAGIGFTVSLFVTELAFGHSTAGNDARLGVLVASLIAAGIGTAILLPGEVEQVSLETDQSKVGVRPSSDEEHQTRDRLEQEHGRAT